jgi:hypothetical protein
VNAFRKLPKSDGMYALEDRTGGRVCTLGQVLKVYSGNSVAGWIAVPVGESADGSPRIAFRTRGAAADALACYVDTQDRKWIA